MGHTAYRQHYSSYTKCVESASLARARSLGFSWIWSDHPPPTLATTSTHCPQDTAELVSCGDATLSQFGAVLFISQSTLLSRIKSRGKFRTRASSCSELDGNPSSDSLPFSVFLHCVHSIWIMSQRLPEHCPCIFQDNYKSKSVYREFHFDIVI